MVTVWLPPADRDPAAGEIEIVVPGWPPPVPAVHKMSSGPVLVNCTVWLCGDGQLKVIGEADTTSTLSPKIGVAVGTGVGVNDGVVAVGAGVTVGWPGGAEKEVAVAGPPPVA